MPGDAFVLAALCNAGRDKLSLCNFGTPRWKNFPSMRHQAIFVRQLLGILVSVLLGAGDLIDQPLRSAPAFGKKILQQRTALLCQNTAHHFGMVIQFFLLE
jgi:hypothetical protein